MMFEYFPGNYVWNLAVVATLNNGGTIGEVDEACRPIREAAAAGTDAGTDQFFQAWSAVADRLVGLAGDDEAAGRGLSAGEKYRRAALYLLNAERMQSIHQPDRLAHYRRAIELQHRGMRLAQDPVEIVEVPYEGSTLPAYFMPATTVDGRPAPCIVQWNGFDSFKEQMLGSGLARELARRGVSTLMVDQPGTGGALRLHGLPAVVDAERPGAACLDYLVGRGDVDADRIGIVGWSLGGYYAPRAAAFEKRFALCVAWDANHQWGQTQRRRREREGENPVPHYWDHALWVWGQQSMDDFEKLWDQITLDGVVQRITVPFLITHGVNDRQIPVGDAHRSYEQAVNSPKAELKIYTEHEGGVEHVNLDDPGNATHFIADWISETFGTADADAPRV
jgi:dienelactone hydrolase